MGIDTEEISGSSEKGSRSLEALVHEVRSLVSAPEQVPNSVRDSYKQMDFLRLVEDDEEFDAPRIFPIKPGDVLIEELPFAAVVNNDLADSVCHHCWKRDSAEVTLKRCTSCHFARYCDGVCAKKGWKVHKLECSRLGEYYKECGFVPDALIRLVNLVLLKVKNGTTTSPEENCNPPTKRTFTSLWSHTAEIDKELGVSGKFQQNMQEIKRYIGQETFAQLSAEMIAETYSRVMTNSISVPDRLGNSLGVGLYFGISQFDHSCLPNAVYFCRHQPPKLSVTATQSLRSLNDVRISYVNPMKPTMERRKELKESYYFVCQCGRCQGVEQDGMSRALQCKTEECGGYVLLGKDWKPMGPCPVCEEWVEPEDGRVQSGADLMGRILKFVDEHQTKFASNLDNSTQAVSGKSAGLLLALHKTASETLFVLNYYRCRLDILLALYYQKSKTDVLTTLAFVDSLIRAYEFYLGPSSMALCHTLVDAARCHVGLKSWNSAASVALRALDIVEILYPPEDQFYEELESILCTCRDGLASGNLERNEVDKTLGVSD